MSLNPPNVQLRHAGPNNMNPVKVRGPTGLYAREAELTAPSDVGSSTALGGRIPITQSRRADAVETTRVIHPLLVAEMDRAIGNVASKQRHPRWLGEIRGGLDNYGNVRCAGDIEAELIVQDAKLTVARLHLRIPGGPSGQARLAGEGPAHGAHRRHPTEPGSRRYPGRHQSPP